MQVLQAQVSGEGRRIAVVVSRFNEIVTGRLLEGALATLAHHGVRDDAITVAWTPGAFELPLAALLLAESGRFDAVVALGAVIRGGTPHFEYVCEQASRGLLDHARTARADPADLGRARAGARPGVRADQVRPGRAVMGPRGE